MVRKAGKCMALKDVAFYHRDPANWFHCLGGMCLALLGGLAALRGIPRLGYAVVSLTDFEVAALLVLIAVRSDGVPRIGKLLPHKFTGLLVLASLFIALILSFSAMYLHCEGICAPGKASCDQASSALEALHSPMDGVYFSVVTMMTLGYGDLVPVTRTARLLVTWELFSGWLLLLMGFPLLLSRMASY